MPRVTIARVTAALAAAGFDGVELVRGQGYFYFVGGESIRWYGTSVMTNRLGTMTPDQWVEEAVALRNEPKRGGCGGGTFTIAGITR